MEFAETLIQTLAVGLAATVVVGLFARLVGARPNWPMMVAIAMGITVAKAIQTQWSISGVVSYFVLGISVGLCASVAQAFTGRKT